MSVPTLRAQGDMEPQAGVGWLLGFAAVVFSTISLLPVFFTLDRQSGRVLLDDRPSYWIIDLKNVDSL